MKHYLYYHGSDLTVANSPYQNGNLVGYFYVPSLHEIIKVIPYKEDYIVLFIDTHKNLHTAWVCKVMIVDIYQDLSTGEYHTAEQHPVTSKRVGYTLAHTHWKLISVQSVNDTPLAIFQDGDVYHTLHILNER